MTMTAPIFYWIHCQTIIFMKMDLFSAKCASGAHKPQLGIETPISICVNSQKATWTVGTVKFGIGDFIAAAINFLIIGFVAWRVSRIFVKPAAEASKKNCPHCRMPMDPAATRCPYCTSQLAPA